MVLARPQLVVFLVVVTALSAAAGMAHGVPVTITFAGLLTLVQLALLSVNGTVADARHLQAAHGELVRIEGVVTASEHVNHSARTTVQVLALHRGQHLHTPHREISLTVFTPQILPQAQKVKLTGVLEIQGSYLRLSSATAVPLASWSGVALGKQVHPIDRWRNTMRETTRHQVSSILNDDQTALVLGMTYGDDAGMREKTKTSFQQAGLTHLTAVSGANITLMFLLGYRLLQWLRAGRSFCIVAGVTVIIAYALMVGHEPSALRALTMGLLGASAMLLGTGRYSLPLLSSAVIISLVARADYALNFGFALSVSATAALILLAPALARHMATVLPLVVAEVIAIPVAAGLWCLPLLVLMVGEIQTYTVLANVLATPLVAPVTVLGIVIVVLTPGAASPAVSFIVDGCSTAAGALVQLLINIATATSALPSSSIPVEPSVLNIALIFAAVAALSALVIVSDWRTGARVYLSSNRGQL
ncbi:ComEC/Rec2 family competence protein [Rothia sp. ZJ1223]|uniref:ComEC/Rec2 family competence protein n=1 Tax=Rothia sp. ZJ1223 TaxID=2811098 RepID=UPI00195B10B0|nr:ComEC/Rec2 family competence protein [Rothia sp. ZJ1223]MBM7050516.1 ComEC/Rec2 family competence protein [Rothia sp. ZJ1223]